MYGGRVKTILEGLLLLQRKYDCRNTAEKGVFLFSVASFLLGLHIYHLFGLLWVSNFVLALGECALAGGFASWYWAFNKPKVWWNWVVVASFPDLSWGPGNEARVVDIYTHYASGHVLPLSLRMFLHLQ